MNKQQLRPLIRKTHRLLGVFIGIQFLGWTISGLYFSWTDINQIHGDYFLTEPFIGKNALNISQLSQLDSLIQEPISSIEYLSDVPNNSLALVNRTYLIDVDHGVKIKQIDQDLASDIAYNYLEDKDLSISNIQFIEEVDPHHEYRGRPLPAWAIEFDHPDRLTAYISAKDAQFQRVRHTNWRIFDFLWMFHTMDYQGRDNFNNFILRAFSLFGLFTVFSGFALYILTFKKKRSK